MEKTDPASIADFSITGGRFTKDKLRLTAALIQALKLSQVRFTPCQTLQLLDHDRVILESGDHHPWTVMCSPLTGVEQGESFDVMPYAQAAHRFLMTHPNREQLPDKRNICFSNSQEQILQTASCDLSFTARKDGKFDVYVPGDPGSHTEVIEPDQILHYINAPGNDQDTPVDLTLNIEPILFTKQGDGSTASGIRIIPQKQHGLYTVVWHPKEGMPSPATLCALSDALSYMPEAELRLTPEKGCYIINLTGYEAQQIQGVTKNDTIEAFDEFTMKYIGE